MKESWKNQGLEQGDGDHRVSPVLVRRYDREGLICEKSEWVIREKPLTLYVNGKELVTLLCAGHHLDELAAGFLHAEGFLRGLNDMEGLDVDVEQGRVDVRVSADLSLIGRMWEKRTVTSGCGKGSLFYYSLDALLSKPVESDLSVSPAQVLDRVDELNRLSETYRRTHGVHNTVLATPEKVLLFRDDIGRHNAVDMIVGHCFLHAIPLSDKFLITTGRLTSELLIKLAKVGMPLVVSRNTATTLAITLAESLGITLVGYARGGRFVVYAGHERIWQGCSPQGRLA
ncbi:MAG: formate dehydrogenase accessory sulfurtransferase FdhD [Deltaproteobacteria bacterium]|nr:formate dehydrogenase accessory sulfurtransferase FdhD [Deltaproteobacteria bacterium]